MSNEDRSRRLADKFSSDGRTRNGNYRGCGRLPQRGANGLSENRFAENGFANNRFSENRFAENGFANNRFSGNSFPENGFANYRNKYNRNNNSDNLLENDLRNKWNVKDAKEASVSEERRENEVKRESGVKRENGVKRESGVKTENGESGVKRENGENGVKRDSGVKSESEVKMRERSIDGELLKEYEQWDFINNELYRWCLREMSINEIKQKYELTNTIQRWLININERYNCVPKYEWFCLLPAVTVDHSAAIFLRDAIVEKQFVNDRSNADKTIERLLSFIRERHKSIEKKYGLGSIARAPLRLEFDSGRQLIIVEKFRCRKIARMKSLVEKGGLVNTARVLLRYESLGNGSYQWGSAQEIYQIFYHQFGVKFEGFASPLDSSLIVYPHMKFCSLFSDTDCVFGSLGDFLYVDMDKYRGGWSLNPPFVNDLMLCVAKRIESVLEIGPYWWFLCRFPYWPDDPGWITLNSSKHLIKRIDFKPRQFTVENTYGNKFKPPMEINIFILGEIPSEMTNLYELGIILLHDLYNPYEDPCP